MIKNPNKKTAPQGAVFLINNIDAKVIIPLPLRSAPCPCSAAVHIILHMIKKDSKANTFESFLLVEISGIEPLTS